MFWPKGKKKAKLKVPSPKQKHPLPELSTWLTKENQSVNTKNIKVCGDLTVRKSSFNCWRNNTELWLQHG